MDCLALFLYLAEVLKWDIAETIPLELCWHVNKDGAHACSRDGANVPCLGLGLNDLFILCDNCQKEVEAEDSSAKTEVR